MNKIGVGVNFLNLSDKNASVASRTLLTAMKTHSELRSATPAASGHQSLLQISHKLEGGDFYSGAVLKTGFLIRSELIITEVLNAVGEALPDHSELHFHLSFHFKLLHQLLVHLLIF